MKNIQAIALAAIFASAWILSACSASAEITQIPKNALIVDVRTTGEYASGHYPGAVNIPLDSVEARLAEFGDKNSPVVVYCRSGRRSGIAKDILTKAGFTQVYNGGGLSHMKTLKAAP